MKEKDEAARLKKYAETFPNKLMNRLRLLVFFRNVERIFENFKVAVNLQSAMVRLI